MLINGYDLKLTSEVVNLLNNYDDTLYAPKKSDIFKAFDLCSFMDTKIVFIGQDPYPTKGDAMGLSFSVNRKDKLPKSLVNIFKELERDLGIVRQNGDLTNLAEQGILFLNSILTVEISKANSHNKLGWQETTNDVIIELSNRGKVIFVLLGKEAQKLEQHINLENNKVIKTSHPSPLGAYRGFNGSSIFSQINNACIEYNYEKISWEN